MPEHLRALVVILAIAAVVFGLARRPLVACGMAPEDFNRRRNLWFGITLAAFLAHDFWLYSLITAAMVLVYGLRDRNPIALYVVLLFAVPPFGVQIPGFGLINYVFELDHIRLLNLTLLLGALVRSSREPSTPAGPAGTGVAGKLLLGYLGLLIVLTMMLSNFTGTMRTTFMLAVDVWLPFYVGYRTLRSRVALREVAAAFALAGALLAAIALFEFAKSWLLYAALEQALNVPWSMGNYLARGEGGALRALASTGHPIVLGYVLVVSLACAIMLAPRLTPAWLRVALFLLLASGLVVSLSRGPWIGAALMVVVALGIGRGAASRLLKLSLSVAALGGLLLVSPWGDQVIGYLPFVGTVDAGSVDYRSRLLEVSLGVLANSPFFGAWDYMLNPAMEEMRQGEGIIDMVNTYLGVAMSTGMVGLTLFTGVFVAAAWACFKAWRAASADPEWERIGRCLLAALAGAALTIATVSSIASVPTLYWLLAGMMLAYSQAAVLAPARSKAGPLQRFGRGPARAPPRSGTYA
jgi:O-antigen ligase